MAQQKQLFYLGRLFQPEKDEILPETLFYDPSHLTTHAIVTGMTGSGKTGLCMTMLEEAALQGIPAIIIDPKGDLTNLLLHFPEMKAADFEPWLDPETARREGKTLPALAEETAQSWRNGLADWGLGAQQILELQKKTGFGIYTPGSNAGYAVNILSSFAYPGMDWEPNREILREKIASISSALLGLVGIKEIDPLRSREHILLSNLLETNWSQGRSLDLAELILQIQTPPFEKLGAFALENFFPAKERLELAMLLNNFLAAPSFQTWMEGQTLDIANLLYTPQGKARHSIFYLAHLGENERMFFVTLLLASIEAWMRAQRGTSALRALVYFDEILGYLPAIGIPPSHTILLRMMKQARAFGVGLLLATQNPVDVDYKALSNAGTWIIGRLQTDQDKQRLMDGLRGAGGKVNSAVYDRLISRLKKRVFLLHNVHQDEPQVFHSRWALNFLAGPMMRSQIGDLNRLEEAQNPSEEKTVEKAVEKPAASKPVVNKTKNGTGTGAYSITRAAIPVGVKEFFMPIEVGLGDALVLRGIQSEDKKPQHMVYIPALLGQAEIHTIARKYNLDYTRRVGVLLPSLEGSLVKWEQYSQRTFDIGKVDYQPLPGALFAPVPGWLSDARRVSALQKDFENWVYRNSVVQIRANEALKVYAAPDISMGKFREMCSQAAQVGMAAQGSKLEVAFVKKLAVLERKIGRQRGEITEQEDEFEKRKMEEMGTHGELIFSLFSKRRRSLSQSLTKRRLTQQAKINLDQDMKELEMLEAELEALENEKAQALRELQARWSDKASEHVEIPLSPLKKDVFLQLFGVAWMPYYLVGSGEKLREVAAFRQGLE